MKIRSGFVSNSSSSSFCIYGAMVEPYKLQEALVAKGAKEDEIEEMGVQGYIDSWNYKYEMKKKGHSEEEAQKLADERPSLTQFEMYDPYDGEYLYFGFSWSSIEDDETGAEFKAKIEAQLKEFFGEDVSCGTQSEAYYC